MVEKKKPGRPRKKPEPVLSDKEYFQLEALNMKMQQLELEKKIKQLEAEVQRRDITIMNWNMKERQRLLKEKESEAVAVNVRIENIKITKGKAVSAITERLQLEDDNWSINPDTLEVIIDE